MSMPAPSAALAGVFPIAPTPFTDTGDLDVEGQRRVLDCNYENRQCGLRATKAVMAEGKVIRSEAVRHPQGPLPPATRAGLLELAREAQPLSLRWGI